MLPLKCECFDGKYLASLFVKALFDNAVSTFSCLFAEVILIVEERRVDFLVVGGELVANLWDGQLFVPNLDASPPGFFLYFL